MSFSGSAGAAAGAFEGDNERKQQAQRDQQLALQAQSLAQQQQQANMQDSRQRQSMFLGEKARKEDAQYRQTADAENTRRFGVSTDLQRKQMDQSRYISEKNLGLAERQQNSLDQDRAFDQKQTLRSNDWNDVLNQQKKERADAEYQNYMKLANEADAKRKAKGDLLMTEQASMIRLALEKQFVAPEVIEEFNKRTGNTVQQIFADGNGGVVFKRLVKDPQTGQQVLADIIADPDTIKTVKESMGMTDVSDPIKNAYYSDRGQALESKNAGKMAEADKVQYNALARLLASQTEKYDTEGAAQTFALMNKIIPSPSATGQQGGNQEQPKQGVLKSALPSAQRQDNQAQMQSDVEIRTLKDGRKVRVRRLPNGTYQLVN